MLSLRARRLPRPDLALRRVNCQLTVVQSTKTKKPRHTLGARLKKNGPAREGICRARPSTDWKRGGKPSQCPLVSIRQANVCSGKNRAARVNVVVAGLARGPDDRPARDGGAIAS